jgi:hypothetical protein
MNKTSALQLSTWRANTDYTPILDHGSMLMYILKYCTKVEDKSEAYKKVLEKAATWSDNNDTIGFKKSMFMTNIGEKDISRNEVAFHLLYDEIYISTVKKVYVSLDDSHMVYN